MGKRIRGVSGAYAGTIFSRAFFDGDGAVDRKGLVFLDNRDVGAHHVNLVRGWRYGGDGGCSGRDNSQDEQAVADHDLHRNAG